jgi:transcription initiation factor IIE alpha subunit
VPVYYKCKICDEEHPSPIAFGDKASFDTATLKNNNFQCPKTGTSALYDKEDMFWRD